MRLEDLVGTWSLESCIAKRPNGAEVFPFGEAPRGLLTYTASGYMSAVLMSSGRQRFASSDHRGGTLEEVKQAFEGFDAYAGTYELDEKSGTVTHHTEVARLPNWEGTAQVRYASLVGSGLHLETPPILSRGQEWVLCLAWRRARSAQA
jgi:Lipocalin-like domain